MLKRGGNSVYGTRVRVEVMLESRGRAWVTKRSAEFVEQVKESDVEGLIGNDFAVEEEEQ